MNIENIDVLVNGGGVAGCAMAYAMALKGLKVMLVEKSDGERILNGADLLKPSGHNILEQYGLLDDILSHGGRKRHQVKIFHNGDFIDELDYRKFDELGYFVQIPYENARKILLRKLADESPVDVRFSTQITDTEFEGSRLNRITLSDGTIICPNVAIGAEGNNAYLRKALGIEGVRDVYDQKMYLGKYPMVDSVDEKNRLYLDSMGGLAYLYPIGMDQCRLVIGFPQAEAKKLLDDTSGQALRERLAQFVTESDDALAQINDTGIFDGIPIARMHIDQYYKGNTVMIGNAIHAVHPITGQGMNLALEDVGALVNCLDDYFNKHTTLEEALQRYQTERYPVNEAVVNYGHTLATTYHQRESFAASLNLHMQGSGRDTSYIQDLQAARA